MRTKITAEKGFTLVEMVVITPIVILAIGAFLTVIITLSGDVIASRAANNLTLTVQDTLIRIEQDVNRSAGFLAVHSVPLQAVNAQGYNDDDTAFTNVGGASGTALILNMAATINDPISGTSSFVYLANEPNPCNSPSIRDNQVMTYNIVYFVKDGTLWRRTVMPSEYLSGSYRCATAWQRPSCAIDYAAAFCVTEDSRLIEGIEPSGFSIQYFISENEFTPLEDASNPALSNSVRQTSLDFATTIEVQLVAEQIAAGRTIQEDANRRSSRLPLFLDYAF